MKFSEYTTSVHKELLNTLTHVSDDQIEVLVDKILNCEKIFLAGAGRSGLMAKAFCMRMMHIGYDAFVVGETVTPNITEKDLLIITSGSGGTASLVSMAEKKASIGFSLALLSIFPNSDIGRLADTVVEIPAPSPKVSSNTAPPSIQPMGSLFEQSLLLVLDIVILRLMERLDLNTHTMYSRHANLE
jgi:6-phospho-3-hexuloisomerase